MSVNSIMKRVGRAVEFLAWTLFFAVAAVVLALRFWLLPEIERYRESIVAAASRVVGQPVQLGGIDADWSGLHPRINLTDVRIYDAQGHAALVLPRVESMLSWRALARGELRLRSLVIERLRVQVRRDPEGGLHVAGIRLTGSEGGGFVQWLLAQQSLELRDAEIEWRDERRAAPPLALASLNLRLENDRGAHALGLAAQPPAELGSTLELRALLRGRSLAEPQSWDGRLYIELGYTELGAWRPWLDYPWSVDHGEGALRLWLALERGQATRVTADLELAEVAASLGDGLAPLRLAAVRGRLQARHVGETFELAARGLALEPDSGPFLGPLDFDARWRPGVGGALAADAVELEPLARLAAALPFPAEARRMLAQVQPRGRLAALRSDWSGRLEAPDRYTASGEFVGLAAAPTGELPGFAGLSGSFEATENAGRVQLESRAAQLALPRVFPGPRIPLDALSGQLRWERLAATLSVQVVSLSVSNAHLSGNFSGSYSYDGAGPGIVDLSAQFNRADARQLANYLPHAHLMGGPATRDWLVKSVLAGESRDVRLRLRGDLADFPFVDPKRGEFSVRAQIDRGVLHYAAGWPGIDDIQGELVFEGKRMAIVARSGSILGVALSAVHVEIPHLGKTPELLVEGLAEGPTAGFLGYVESSPVRSRTGGLTDSLKASGRARLRLKLALPLADLPRAKVAGDFEILDNNVQVHGELPAIERASGRVRFTQSGFTVHDVRGQLFGGPVLVSGGTQPNGSVEVAARGHASVQAARPFFDHPLAARLSGATDYSALVTIGQGRARFRLESDLRGLASALPAPLAKAADDALALSLEVAPLEGGAREYIAASLGPLVRAAMVRAPQGERMVLQRAAVALTPPAGARLRLPPQPGILVSGALPALDLDEWRAALGVGSGQPAALAARFDLKIAALKLYGKQVNQAALRGEAGPAGWNANVAAREIAGDLSWRDADGGRLTVRLAHLYVPEDSPQAPPGPGIAPGDLPSIDLTAERVEYQGRQLGRVELAAQTNGGDWRIDRLAMASPGSSFKASGLWRSGTPSLSSLEFHLETADAGGLLDRLGYRGLVKGGRAKLDGSLSWIGPPTAIGYPSLAGQVKLEAREGQFLEIEPGLGKLVSLMSLQSLPRRIAFDFRDVFSKGFEFQSISSGGTLARGAMALSEFRMRGSAAEVAMTGTVDLAAETQDLRVRVVPRLGDSASTVIALVNPLLAIPAAIAQKILKDPLGQIFAFDYAVTGSWAEPNVERVGVQQQPAEPQ